MPSMWLSRYSLVSFSSKIILLRISGFSTSSNCRTAWRFIRVSFRYLIFWFREDWPGWSSQGQPLRAFLQGHLFVLLHRRLNVLVLPPPVVLDQFSGQVFGARP